MKTAIPKPDRFPPNIDPNGAAQTIEDGESDLKRTICCPACRRNLRVGQDAHTDALIHCGCGMQFALGDALSLLAWLEIIVPKMIIGLLVFVSQRIPQWCFGLVHNLLESIGEYICLLLPLSWRIARLAGWVALWASILFGPTLAICLVAFCSHKFLPHHLKLFSLGLWALAAIWFLFVAAGYAWAYRCYRRKRKQVPVALAVPPTARLA